MQVKKIDVGQENASFDTISKKRAENRIKRVTLPPCLGTPLHIFNDTREWDNNSM